MAEMKPNAVAETGLMQMVISPTFQSMMRQSFPAVGLTPARMTRVIATEFRKTPKLAKCEPASFYRSIMLACELGLVPGGAQGFCYLIPYGRECTFVLGYKGALHLAWRTMQLQAFDAHFVWEGDVFDYAYGTKGFLKHIPVRDPDKRGDPVGVWCELWPSGAERSMFRFMSYEECLQFRARYVKAKNGPWFEPLQSNAHQWMCMKTVIKQLLKLGPTSAEVSRALRADDSAEMGQMPEEIDITNESELIDMMMSEGEAVNADGGYTGDAPAGPPNEEVKKGGATREKQNEAKEPTVPEGERCGGPHDCVRKAGHKDKTCLGSDGKTWDPNE